MTQFWSIDANIAINDEESIGEEEDGKAGIVQLAAENFSEEGISLESNERGYSFKIVGGDYATDTKFFGSDDKDTVANVLSQENRCCEVKSCRGRRWAG